MCHPPLHTVHPILYRRYQEVEIGVINIWFLNPMLPLDTNKCKIIRYCQGIFLFPKIINVYYLHLLQTNLKS